MIPAHAALSPSSAERWLSCPASIRMINSLERSDDGGSVWAEEGTRAHTLAEIEASHAFDLTTREQYDIFRASWLATAMSHGDDIEEMERHARGYVALLQDIVSVTPNASLFLEQKVQTGVPGCWGTGDAIIVSPEVIHVVDLKYGQGVLVVAHENPQLMLYGVGALELYDGVLGDTQEVIMTIYQPRVSNGTTRFSMSANALREWRNDVVLPLALETQDPAARFGPSEVACRWCPAAGICKPRMSWVTQRDFGNPDLLTPDELAEAVMALAVIRDWCNAVEAEALKQAYSEGVTLPGLKVVLSGGKRSIPSIEAAIDALVEAGFTEEQVTRPNLKTLSDLEKMVGKEKLAEVLGPLLVKSDGKPALVSVDDPRPSVDSLTAAIKDFQGAPALDE